MAGVVLDRDLRPDLEIAETVARILKDRRALIGAVGDGGDQRPHLLFGHVQKRIDTGIHLLLAIFLKHVQKRAFADLAGADQGVEVALLIAARAHVGQDHVQHVLARLPPVPDLDRRNAQAFGVDLFRTGVIARRHRAADIGQVALADGPVFQAPLPEDRPVETGVDGVAATPGGVVVDDQVALVDVVAEIPRDDLHRRDERAEVDRNILPLKDHLGCCIEQRRGIVMRQVEHARPCGLFQAQRHLALGRFQNPAHDR